MRRICRPKNIVKTARLLKTLEGEIPFVLKRSSSRRTLTITVDSQAYVSVSSPLRMRDEDIHAFIHRKARWIIDKVETARKNREVLQRKAFEDGHYFLFLGNTHVLHVIEEDVKRARVVFDPAQGWSVSVPRHLPDVDRRRQVKERMEKWYRFQAEEILGGRVFHYARLMAVEPKKISVRTQKRLWGCCDYRAQAIRLNWQIILSPIEVVDYVVVHELCHLTIPNHSRRFWKRVEKFMPEYARYRLWLKKNHLEMVLP